MAGTEWELSARVRKQRFNNPEDRSPNRRDSILCAAIR